MFQLIDSLPSPLPQIGYFFLALFPLVLIHELGHFVLAKLNKVRVDEFGIGFPPRLFKLFSDGETEYTFNLLPLGGFVRLAGEDDPTVPGAFASRSKLARAAVLFAGPAANFLAAALFLSGLAMVKGVLAEMPAEVPLVQVGSVTEDGVAGRAGVLADDVVVALDGASLADLAAALPAEDSAAEPRTPAMRVLMEHMNAHQEQATELTLLRGASFVGFDADPAKLRTEAAPGFDGVAGLSASRVVVGDGGLVPGDILWDFAAAPAQDPLVLRGRPELVRLEVTPRRDQELGRGLIDIGITAPTLRRHLDAPAALAYGPGKTVQIMGAMVVGLGQMIRAPSKADIAGPVGISRLSQQVAREGWENFLLFMALLSINLGVINLLPIPALDGGRLIFIGLEALRGRRIEPSREAVVHLVGFALVIGLMLVITAYEVFGKG